MKSMINLPEDVLNNRILLKLDMKSLRNLRCVCKYSRSLISSTAFVKMHCHDQLNNNPLVLVYCNKNLFCSLNFNGIDPSRPKRMEMVPSQFSQRPFFFGSCNGVLCLVERENSPPSLWNPTTKEYKELPPPLPASVDNLSGSHVRNLSCHNVTYGFGYDCIIEDYKVIQYESFSHECGYRIGNNSDDNYSIMELQVYTLGTDTWRRINDNPYHSYFSTLPHYQTPGMFVNGALHWVVREKEYFGSKIIAFDIEKEMFRAEIPKPHSGLSDSSNYWSLNVLKGCLCIYEDILGISQCRDVWMMKDYGVMDSWTKLFTIMDCDLIPSPGFDFKVLKFCENGEVLVAMDHGIQTKLILYDPITKASRGVEFGKCTNFMCFIEVHVESFASLNTGIYRESSEYPKKA